KDVARIIAKYILAPNPIFWQVTFRRETTRWSYDWNPSPYVLKNGFDSYAKALAFALEQRENFIIENENEDENLELSSFYFSSLTPTVRVDQANGKRIFYIWEVCHEK